MSKRPALGNNMGAGGRKARAVLEEQLSAMLIQEMEV